MKKFKLVFLIVSMAAYAFTVNAQSGLTMEASQLYASFKYKDSQGTKLNNEYSGLFTGAYGIGYRYISDGGFIFRSGIGMRSAGATLVYDDMNYSWKLQYADIKLGLGYMYKAGRVNPYLTASGYFAYLLRGIQTLNNEDFNIIESGLLNKTDFGVTISPGVEFRLSDYISSCAEFNYLMGLKNIEADDGQKASNIAYGISLGLSFTITKIE